MGVWRSVTIRKMLSTHGMDNVRVNRSGILSGLLNWTKIFGWRRKSGERSRGISMPSYENTHKGGCIYVQ